jgi:hypothetical protein
MRETPHGACQLKYKSGMGFSYHTILYNEDKNNENVLAQFYSIRFKDKK